MTDSDQPAVLPPPPPPLPPPPPSYPQYGYTPGGPPVFARTNGLAIGSLVCALISPFLFGLLAIPALILGYAARRAIARSGGAERGAGIALAGIVIGWLVLVLSGVVLTAALLGDDDRTADDIDQLVTEVGTACRQEGVAGAGTHRGAGPFHLVVVGDRGRQIPWSTEEANWRAEDLADTDLVACVAQQSNLIETCPYIGGSDIERYEAVVRVRVVTARSGRQIDSFRLTDEPRQCQMSELVSTVRLDGDVPFRQVSRRLDAIARRPAGGSS